jgi:glycosyltransferase involved in cell wall biosynthesis/O-antigen/teichoic acid export membrane protein
VSPAAGRPLSVWLVKIGEPIPRHGTGARMRGVVLAETLARRGHRVLWWTSAWDHFGKRWLFPGDEHLRLGEGVEAFAIRGTGYRRNTSPARLVDHRVLAWRWERLAGAHPPPDVMVVAMPTHDLAFRAVRFARRRGVPVVLDLRDPWPDSFTDLAPPVLRPAFRALLARERAMLRHAVGGADSMVAVTEALLQREYRRGSRAPGPLDRVFYTGRQPGAAEAGAGTAPPEWIRRLEGRFVVAFTGTFAFYHDPTIALRAAERMPQAAFVLAGGGGLLEQVRERARTLPNVVLPGWLGAADLAHLLRASHVGICPSPTAAEVFPNKAFGYFAAGLPVVSSFGGDIHRLIERRGMGLNYPPGNANALAECLERLRSDPALRERMARSAERAYAELFDAGRTMEEYADHVERVALERARPGPSAPPTSAPAGAPDAGVAEPGADTPPAVAGRGLGRRRDFAVSFAANAAVIVVGAASYRLAGELLGATGLAEYALSRRAISFALPPVAAGIGYALPRYVAADGAEPGARPGDLLRAAVVLLAGTLGVLLLACNALPRAAAALAFGDGAYAGLVAPISLCLVGHALHLAAFGYLRGRLHIGWGHLLQVVNYAAAPVLSFALARGSVHALLWLNGGMVALASAGTAAAAALRSRGDGPARIGPALRRLAAYGLPRVPGEFALAALLAAPAFAAARAGGIRAGAVVAFGSTLITLAGAGVSPLATVILPHAVRLIHRGEAHAVRAGLWRAVRLAALAAGAGVAAGEVFAGSLSRLFLGPGFGDAAPLVRLMLPAALPYVVHVVLHAGNDAADARALNARSAYAGLAVFTGAAAAGWLAHGGVPALLAAFVAGMCTLAAVTARSVFRLVGAAPAGSGGA